MKICISTLPQIFISTSPVSIKVSWSITIITEVKEEVVLITDTSYNALLFLLYCHDYGFDLSLLQQLMFYQCQFFYKFCCANFLSLYFLPLQCLLSTHTNMHAHTHTHMLCYTLRNSYKCFSVAIE